MRVKDAGSGQVQFRTRILMEEAEEGPLEKTGKAGASDKQ